MQTHPDIDLMTAKQQTCSRLAATCAHSRVGRIIMTSVISAQIWLKKWKNLWTKNQQMKVKPLETIKDTVMR